jgi:hypothetical protein
MKKIIITIFIISSTLFLAYIFWQADFSEQEANLSQLLKDQKETASESDKEEIRELFIAENNIEQVVLPIIEDIETGETGELAEEIDKEIITEKNTKGESLENEENKSEGDKTKLLLSVPFMAQAPLGNWSDPRQQDACEEAGVLMAMAWVNNEKEPSLIEAEKMIIELADWQQENYGEHRDLHIREVADILFKEYFNYDKVELKEVERAEELIKFLEQGYLILAPTDGQALKNPYFTAPGPERHLLAIIGYDYNTELFITNDPGTRQGRNFKYPKNTLFEAIRAYPSGYHEPIIGREKLILLVSC